jgi:uncharacterized protein
MRNHNYSFLKFLLVFVLGFISFYLIQNFTPLDQLSFLNRQTSTITVRGSAQEDVLNQLAEFTAGIEVIAAEKEEAINSANTIMEQLLVEIDNFGIAKEDVQTSQVSVYQEEEKMIDPVRNPEILSSSSTMIIGEDETGKVGDWRANISITITMRNEDSELLKNRSEELLNILNNSQANYVYGPNFRLDQQNLSEIDLINAAIADARSKAEAIAAANQQQIKKILEVLEDGVSSQPFYRSSLAAIDQESVASPSLEPGSSTLSKTVLVTFQVK